MKGQKDGNFFEKVKKEAKDALTKEEISHKRKKREENIEEVITIAQYQVQYEITILSANKMNILCSKFYRVS